MRREKSIIEKLGPNISGLLPTHRTDGSSNLTGAEEQEEEEEE